MKNTADHGNSFGKSFLLLLRSLANLISFSVLWYSLIFQISVFFMPLWTLGAILTALCIVFDLILPCVAASKANIRSTEQSHSEQ